MRTEAVPAMRDSANDYPPKMPPLPNAPRPRLSPTRVLVALVVLVAIGAGVALAVSDRIAAAPAAAGAPVFAPYVDVTLTPTYEFQNPAANPVGDVYLGFLVADHASPCTPSWGGYYRLAAAQSALNLDERISQVRAQGGTPIASFGGRDNSELAMSCNSVPALTSAYLAPIQRYQLSAIDLDIEGAAVSDAAAGRRRALAIAAAQRTRAAQGRPLAVWLSLPVATTGLTPAGLSVLKSMLAAHVTLAGVNVLAMDFGPREKNMIGPVEQAINATSGQLVATYSAAHVVLRPSSPWRHLGATVMIGQNDVAGEVFTLPDARALVRFANSHHLARVSMWSLNRDFNCGSVFAQTGVLSNTCSGVTQTPLQFTRILGSLSGTSLASPAAGAASQVPQVPLVKPDDPARSPDPIWQSAATYVTGYTVVWHRNVYQAKWSSTGFAPDTPASSAAQTPWLLIGPVLAGARPPQPKLLDTGRHPAWSPAAVYHEGDIVQFNGLPFKAKWYTRGDQPSTTLPAIPGSPWQPRFTIPGEPTQGVSQ